MPLHMENMKISNERRQRKLLRYNAPPVWGATVAQAMHELHSRGRRQAEQLYVDRAERIGRDHAINVAFERVRDEIEQARRDELNMVRSEATRQGRMVESLTEALATRLLAPKTEPASSSGDVAL